MDILPDVGLGDLRFGMDRAEVRRVLAAPYDSFMKTPSSKNLTNDFGTLSIHVFYTTEEKCKGIELFRPACPRLEGHAVLDQPYRELFEWIAKRDPGR